MPARRSRLSPETVTQAMAALFRASCLGISRVVGPQNDSLDRFVVRLTLALHERLDVGGRNQPDLMAKLPNFPPPEGGTAASCHRDNAWLHLPEESQHLMPTQLSVQNLMPRSVSTVCLEALLC